MGFSASGNWVNRLALWSRKASTLLSSSNAIVQASTLPAELTTQMPCGASLDWPIPRQSRPSSSFGGLLTRPALRATGTKSALTRRMTSGLEKTASRTAPANTQQRASSMGRSIKTQSKAGLFLARDSLSPSSKQLFQAISRQATLDDFRASISAVKASGVAGFFSATGDGWAQARPAKSTEHTTTVRLRTVLSPSLLGADPAQGEGR